MLEPSVLIELKKVQFSYNQRPLLAELSLSIKAGEFVFINGGTGTGKSTLCRLLCGLIRPSAGEYWLAGDQVEHYNAVQWRWLRRSMGIMTQDLALLEDRSVLDNVALPAIVAGESAHEAQARAMQALIKCGLSDWSHVLPSSLSAGQKQLVALARAIVNRPVVIIADEPLAQVDHQNAQTLLALLSSFAKAGVTVIITGHRKLPFNVPHLREIPLQPLTVEASRQ